MTAPSTTSDLLIAELRAGLEGVTPGPWTVFFDGSDKCWLKVGAGGMPEYYSDIIVIGPCENDKDAEFIGICSPDNIRTLLDHIASLEALLDAIIARDDRNGSLPIWYRQEIDAVYSRASRTPNSGGEG